MCGKDCLIVDYGKFNLNHHFHLIVKNPNFQSFNNSFSQSMASSSTIVSNHRRYDVFISFHEDTRFSFTDHLFESLIGAGIRTFKDTTGEDSNPQIDTAITVSRASIVVLSKNYANSSSCLDQLLLIMERRKGFYHVVLPVFYHVDPSDFRKHETIYALNHIFQKPPKCAEHKIDQWKLALMELASLTYKALSG